MKKIFIISVMILIMAVAVSAAYCQDDDNTRNILKQGLLGAGTGAIASGASGGNAGQGALIGAGTNVIGGALLDMMTTPSRPAQTRYVPVQQQPQQQYYSDQGPAEEYYYEEPPQESGSSKIIKQGLLGAGTGALASGMSGGNAGKGALIGAGTNVIGGALLDAITQPSQPKRVYYRPAPQQRYAPQQQYAPPQQYSQPQQTSTTTAESVEGTRKKIIRKYDDSGKVISEEEIYY
jgi:hypothetical protein